MSNTDNMMITAVLSTMLTFKSMIIDEQPHMEPPQPMTVIERL